MEYQFIQVFTTTSTKEEAERISEVLLEFLLAACVQIIGPIKSAYWWKGNIETTEEWLLLIKSEKRLYKEIEKVIKKFHSYETPEIVAVPIVEGSPEYLNWLKRELR